MKLPDDYPLGAVAAFLLLVACLVTLRSELPEGSMSELHWVLAVAAIPLLPWLLPLAARHISNVRAGPVELALRDLDPEQIRPGVAKIDDVADALTEVSITDMPERSHDILERVRELEAKRTEVVAVDLSRGTWKLGTLYLFAFMLESRTIVRRIVFERRSADTRAFRGMCSPRALRQAIEREHPIYHDVRKRTPLIDLDASGPDFFRALAAQSETTEGEASVSPALTDDRVEQLLRTDFEPEWLDRSELEGLPGLRRVLSSERRYLAVVERGTSYQVLDRLRVALAVARRAIDA
jgi:hypothetical protein